MPTKHKHSLELNSRVIWAVPNHYPASLPHRRASARAFDDDDDDLFLSVTRNWERPCGETASPELATELATVSRVKTLHVFEKMILPRLSDIIELSLPSKRPLRTELRILSQTRVTETLVITRYSLYQSNKKNYCIDRLWIWYKKSPLFSSEFSSIVEPYVSTYT